jgi:hypothetical protein
MILLLAFFAFLHCWLNLFGELLRFGDRMFYKVCETIGNTMCDEGISIVST